MSITTIGILSDTHLSSPTEQFKKLVDICFADASIIFHAGDLTDITILDAFKDKQVHGVHGNMCRATACHALPREKQVAVGPYLVAITHGMQYRMKYGDYIEEQLLLDFPEADCIIYGHTHVPVCRRIGKVLIMNPGSFSATGPYGSPGTYGILNMDNGLHGKILQAPKI